MQPLIQQLEHLRRRARILLVLMRGATWLATVLGVAVVAGFGDYLLRLPGWMRLGLIVAGVVVAGFYFIRLMGRAVRVYPMLPTLALRLERLYPATAGRLASAVAFATHGPVGGESEVTTNLARRTTDAAEGLLNEDQVDRLIDPRPAFRAVVELAVVVGLFSGVALGAPDSFSIAVQRWTDPLGPAKWPNRYQVQSLTTRRVAPNNAPLALIAHVLKGDREKLRTWLVYRFVREDQTPGQWQRGLMSRQNDEGRFERLLEPNPAASKVEFYFEAGDDATQPQSVKLIQPPTLTALIAEVAPPPYAAEVLPLNRQDLLQPPRPVVTLDALEGSRVHLRFTVQGSLERPGSEAGIQELKPWLEETFEGLLGDDGSTAWDSISPSYTDVASDPTAAVFEVAFSLHAPLRLRLRFADAFGTRYDDARLFAFEVRPDRLPRAAVTAPVSDPMVLPTAVLPLAAEGNDDVAVRRLDLVARAEGHEPLALGSDEGGLPRARVEARIDLQPLKLTPGDSVVLVAVARDNFRLGDREHDPVESAPRTLRIIEPEELSRQLHAELADLRQRTLRAKAMQEQLAEAPPGGESARGQQELGERVEAMGRVVGQLRERVELNRFDDENTEQTLDMARSLLGEAGEASAQAAGRLSQAAMDPGKAEEQTRLARTSQQQSAEKLGELAQLLDQGRDAYELKQNLIRIAREQQALTDRVRHTLPKTLGRGVEQLDEEQKKELGETSQAQQELSRETRELAERMRSTAAAISRQSQDPGEQAMAEAMRQAAETATRENLDQKMERAAQQARENRLADAQQSQQQAQQALRQMLEQIDRAEQLKQQVLRRKLTEMVDAIRRLRDQQQAQIDRLMAAKTYDDLDGPMLILRRNTLSVSETARRADPKAGPVADALDRAAGHQNEAITGLRVGQVDPAPVEAAERASLAALDEALKLAEELSRDAEQEMTAEERRKLVEAYAQALELERAIRDETQALHEAPPADRGRRWRADALKLSKRQEEVGVALSELKTKVESTIVYRSVHEQMDRWIKKASGDLAAAEPTGATVFQQELTLASIEEMIQAMLPEDPDEQFAEGEEGSGSGGGQGGEKAPLVPPLAELKLLRERQDSIASWTRALEGEGDEAVKPTILQELAAQQESLAETGKSLLEQIQQQQGPRPRLPDAPEELKTEEPAP